MAECPKAGHWADPFIRTGSLMKRPTRAPVSCLCTDLRSGDSEAALEQRSTSVLQEHHLKPCEISMRVGILFLLLVGWVLLLKNMYIFKLLMGLYLFIYMQC